MYKQTSTRVKAREGERAVEGIDYDDAFPPIVRMESVQVRLVRVRLALAAQEGWRVQHMDVTSVFLNGNMREEVYMRQPPGFVVAGQEENVYRLRKALYGLRQANAHGTLKLDATFKEMGFQ